MYYKWYVIIAVIVLGLVISTVHQVVTAPKYDITLVYAGGTVYDQAAEDALNKKLSENVRDVNENGETLAQLLQYNFAIDSKEVEYAMAMDVKLQMALSEDETFIFIMDKELLERYKDSDLTLAFHSAPQDVDKDIKAMYEVFGDRPACAVREISKIHEEAKNFTLAEGLAGEKRGEYVLIVGGAEEKESPLNALSEREHIQHYMAAGLDKKEALKRAAKDRGVSKSELYPFSIDL